MPGYSSFAAFARGNPLLAAWLVFATYGASAAALVQFLVLPVFAPGLHAGHGLLAGNDSVGYHAIAASMADNIRQSGWSAWSLAPQGHAAAGLAAPFYYLLAPSPWSLIPVNAALHATAGTLVMQLTHKLCADWKIAFTAAALWIGFPSSLQWVTQIQKDGYFFAGILGALLGWSMFLRIVCARPDAPALHRCAGLLFAGITVAGLVRLYSFRLMLLITLVIAAFTIPMAIANARRGRLAAGRCIAIICLVLGIAAALSFAPRDLRFESTVHDVAGSTAAAPVEFVDGKSWRSSKLLPAIADRAFMRLAIARHGYLSESYKSAGSMIDLQLQFNSAQDVIAYLPRALQIGFLAPFPAQWMTPGASPGGTAMRFVAGIEMLAIYPLLMIGLPLAAWRWRARPEFWLMVAFCTFFILTYACVTPNIGSLYRLRYGLLMTLAGLGLAGVWTFARDCRARTSSN